jgi:GxxExxY protein
MQWEHITAQIISTSMKIHSDIGPGMLESVYRRCLQQELINAGVSVRAEVALPVLYNGLHLESGFRLDLLVENTVIVELKAIEAILPIHKAQLLTYLRFANMPLGLLLNFNVLHLRDGIKRVINNRYRS